MNIYTSEQRRYNLNSLADYLLSLSADYNYFYYSTTYRPIDPTKSIHGDEKRCALEHTFLAIKDLPINTFKGYMELIECAYGLHWHSYERIFIFSIDWAKYDSNPQGVGIRIKYYLNNDNIPIYPKSSMVKEYRYWYNS